MSSRPSDQKLPKNASSELLLCLFAYWCFLRGPTWSFCIILREENSKTGDITQNAYLAGKKNSAEAGKVRSSRSPSSRVRGQSELPAVLSGAEEGEGGRRGKKTL